MYIRRVWNIWITEKVSSSTKDLRISKNRSFSLFFFFEIIVSFRFNFFHKKYNRSEEVVSSAATRASNYYKKKLEKFLENIHFKTLYNSCRKVGSLSTLSTIGVRCKMYKNKNNWYIIIVMIISVFVHQHYESNHTWCQFVVGVESDQT